MATSALAIALVAAACGHASDGSSAGVQPTQAPAVEVAPPATWQGPAPDLPCARGAAGNAPGPSTAPPDGWFQPAAPHFVWGWISTGQATFAMLPTPTAGLDQRAAAVLALLPQGFGTVALETSQQATCDGAVLRVSRFDRARFERPASGERASVTWTTLWEAVNPVPVDFGPIAAGDVHSLAGGGGQWITVDLAGNGVVRYVYLAGRDGRMVTAWVAGRGSEQYSGWPTTAYWGGGSPEPSSIGLDEELRIAEHALQLR